MDAKLSRRSLLGAGAAALLAPSLPFARAEDLNGKRLIVVFATGGWDVTYCLDPKIGLAAIDGPDLDQDPDNPEDVEAIQTFGEIPIAVNAVKRPSVGAFFEAWGSRCTVVNGIWVGSIAHRDNQIRMMTGTRTPESPDLAAITGFETGSDKAIPYLALGSATFTGELATYAGRTGNSNQLRYLLDPSLRQRPPTDFPFGAYPQALASDADRGRIEAFLHARTEAYRGLRGQSTRAAAKLDAYEESLLRSRELLGDGPYLAESLFGGRGNSLRARAEAALSLLTSGMSHTVSLDTGVSWDTHQNIAIQHQYYELLFSDLGYLLTRLQEESLLDDTVVWVVSEMTRTPRRNETGGKDHWNSTSALVINGGPGGVTLGGTDEYLTALPVDLGTGVPEPGGQQLRYDQFAAGLLASLGVDPEAWLPGVSPLAALSA